ncbi:hypothetical protein BDQ12DRAFT_653964 [Crucibulum laeve]|uniref:Uncharacterized protein n=1 Tax=Crucibulum laeve TaxID=68775 RepID=A0A5C3LVT1_9AGAR|nr:hypothetical protein BDQ12DRAFT_653964 [Crucibulum laeve]
MDSIFTDRLGTNYVPSDGEIDEIKRYLSAPEAQLRELEKEIARIQTILEDLMRKQDAILLTIEGHRALISPARRLPRDVVQEIFLQCLPEKHNAIMSGREAPLILGRICREWRDVALHTPQLWSSIHIPLILYGTTDDEVRLDILRYNAIKSWLNKSGACPLSISLPAVRGHADEPYTETSKLLLDYLLTHVKRWKWVEFNIPNKILEALSSVSPVDDLSCLEKLDFSLFYQHPDSNPGGFNLHNSNLLKAPNLRSLAVRLGNENIPSLPVS